MAAQIQIRRDTAANWASSDPILAQGEFGLETDTLIIRIGDGTTAFTSLPSIDTDTVAAHALGGAEHTADTLANLNTKVSDATLIDTGDSRLSDARTPTAHNLGGAEHSADTLANLNTKVSDATLIDTGDSRLSDDRTASGLRSATTVVSVSGATAPSTGQVLKATSSTAATWQAEAGGSAITVEDEGTPLTTAVTKLNFAGAGVTVTEPVTDEMLITIPSGGSSIEVQDEGSSLTTAVTKFNFVGDGVVVTEPVADEMLVTIGAGTSSEMDFVRARNDGLTLTGSGTDDTITWDQFVGSEETDSGVVEFAPGGDYTKIRAKQAGSYLISYSLSVESTQSSPDQRVTAWAAADTTLIPGSQITCDVNVTTARKVLSASVAITLTVNQDITIVVDNGGSGNASIVAAAGGITVTRLLGKKGIQGATGSGSDINIYEEGGLVTGGPFSSLNFIGGGVTATDGGSNQADITITADFPKLWGASSSTPTSTTSATYVDLANTSFTPAAGFWYVVLSATGYGSTQGQQMTYGIAKNGTVDATSERTLDFNSGAQGDSLHMTMHSIYPVITDGTDVITARYKTDSGTFTVNSRRLIMFEAT